MRQLSRAACVVVLVVVVLSLGAGVAVAYDESTSTVPAFTEGNCGRCHNPFGYSSTHSPGTVGVHGGYTAATSRCNACHTLHNANAARLLPRATIKATCETCHDGTGGRGVYGAIAARGLTVAAGHSVETTNVVPGGSAATGGVAIMALSGQGGTLTCTDCHSPHGSDLVAAFQGDRYRIIPSVGPIRQPDIKTRMLKQRPGGALTATAEYGSDWCLACHKGRSSALGGVHNHPVDSKDTVTTPFVYSRVARLDVSGSWTGTTVANQTMGLSNQGYLMPLPRTPQQAGHAPICQQCHEDARSLGSLSSDGTQANVTPFLVTMPDGLEPTSNPRFQNFPHETTNYRMLVEAGTMSATDDLCLNCHPAGQLP